VCRVTSGADSTGATGIVRMVSPVEGAPEFALGKVLVQICLQYHQNSSSISAETHNESDCTILDVTSRAPLAGAGPLQRHPLAMSRAFPSTSTRNLSTQSALLL